VVVSSAARSARSGQEACDAIDRVVQTLTVARRERVDGLVARAGEDTRRGVDQAFPEYEEAVSWNGSRRRERDEAAERDEAWRLGVASSPHPRRGSATAERASSASARSDGCSRSHADRAGSTVEVSLRVDHMASHG
jgi:hypothetical protein